MGEKAPLDAANVAELTNTAEILTFPGPPDQGGVKLPSAGSKINPFEFSYIGPQRR
ncbi:hypothetical protein RSK20926_11549 [Roseobacter sp. SK209-2-6]|nr:hypothetical protein RSK20926_11549 [Roseobacter sp. SK209-2-6]